MDVLSRGIVPDQAPLISARMWAEIRGAQHVLAIPDHAAVQGLCRAVDLREESDVSLCSRSAWRHTVATRRRMKDRYRRFAALTDVGGIKSAIGEAKGFFFPKQPRFNKECAAGPGDRIPDEEWFRKTIKEK